MSAAWCVRRRAPRAPVGPHAGLRRWLATCHVHPHLLDHESSILLILVLFRTLPPAGAGKSRGRGRRHIRQRQKWVGRPGTGRGTHPRRAPRTRSGPHRGPCGSRSGWGPWGLRPHYAPSGVLCPFLRQLPGPAFLLRLLPRPLCTLWGWRRPRRGRSRGIRSGRPATDAAGSCALGGRGPLDFKRWSLCSGRGRSGGLGHCRRDARGGLVPGHLQEGRFPHARFAGLRRSLDGRERRSLGLSRGRRFWQPPRELDGEARLGRGSWLRCGGRSSWRL
jgi:hypothetical protein